jgi:hypothetical protein
MTLLGYVPKKVREIWPFFYVKNLLYLDYENNLYI